MRPVHPVRERAELVGSDEPRRHEHRRRGSDAAFMVSPRGMTVNRTVCLIAMSCSAPPQANASAYSPHGCAVVEQLPELRVAARSAEGALDRDFDRHAEESDLDLHGERGPAVGLVARRCRR